MNLSIITVNFNDKRRILAQIASVASGAAGLEYEQIVSDNGSTDGSVAEIRRRFPQVKIIENGKNLGFAAANNRALEAAKGEFLLFLNPDMRVLPGTLKIMLDWMRARPAIGVAGPKLVNEKGEWNRGAGPRRFPGFWNQAAVLLKLSRLFPALLNHYLYKDLNFAIEQEVDSIRGSFLLMRREIAKRLGRAFDPRYFIWFEDVDTCREAKRLGYKVFYTPIISVVDYLGQSFKSMPDGLKQRWFTASMVKYFKKWEPRYKWLPIVILRPIAIFLADLKVLIFKR